MDRSSSSRASRHQSQTPSFQYSVVDHSSSSRTPRQQSTDPWYTMMDRSEARSLFESRRLRLELGELSISEEEPSRYDSQASQYSQASHGSDRQQSRTATASRYEPRTGEWPRISSMGDRGSSKTVTSSRYESKAPQEPSFSSTSDRQQSATATYMDPSKPLVIDRAPASRRESRTSSQLGRSRDTENRRDADRSYEEEVTIRITRKVSHRSSHRG